MDQDLMRKYGTNLTWENGQASGTCLGSSHSKLAVNAIKSGIMSGRTRVHVFGPVYMVLAGDDKTTAAILRTRAIIAKKAGLGRYLGDRWAGPFNASWETLLADALFKVSIYCHENPHIQAEYDGLSFPSLERFVEFADEFLNEAGTRYTCSISLSCYFLEDKSIPKIGQVQQRNAFMGALCDAGGIIVDPTALRNPIEPDLLANTLTAIFLEHTGITLPPMPIEDLASLFWVHRPRNKKAQYNANITVSMVWGLAASQRSFWDPATSSLVPSVKNHGLTGGEIRYWSLNWSAKAVALCGGPLRSIMWPSSTTDAPTSVIMTNTVTDDVSSTLLAVHITACGCDNLVIGYENGSEYQLQFVEETAIGETSAFRTHDLPPSPSQNNTHSDRYYKRDWMTRTLRHTCRTHGKSYGDTRARLKRIGTPFVGTLSDWAIKDLAGIPGTRFTGCVVE